MRPVQTRGGQQGSELAVQARRHQVGQRVQQAVPPNGSHVEASARVALPDAIRGRAYAVRADGRQLVLDHPDPDIGFAEGRFYLITQFKNDFISPGPWVEKVTARVGVDTTNDGEIDTWTDWTEVKETYDYIDGFAKQISKTPAEIDLSSLPSGYGFQFEFKTTQTTDNGVLPVMDKITLNF